MPMLQAGVVAVAETATSQYYKAWASPDWQVPISVWQVALRYSTILQHISWLQAALTPFLAGAEHQRGWCSCFAGLLSKCDSCPGSDAAAVSL